MCSAPWYSKTRRSSFRRVTAHRYSRKIVIRTSFSTSTNTIELGSSSLTRLVSPTGSRKNSPTAIASANVTVPIHVAREIGSSSSADCALAAMFSALMPIRSDSPSATTPRTTGQRSQRWRLRTETSGKLWTSISPSAASPGSSWRPPSSCSGSGMRTATAHVETPRIITPSSTACPPTGRSRPATRGSGAGSRCASCAAANGGSYVPGWRLAARRLKRSTRPPVSTSFWRPV